MERDGGFYSFYYEALEGAIHTGYGFGAVVAVGYYFGD